MPFPPGDPERFARPGGLGVLPDASRPRAKLNHALTESLIGLELQQSPNYRSVDPVDLVQPQLSLYEVGALPQVSYSEGLSLAFAVAGRNVIQSAVGDAYIRVRAMSLLVSNAALAPQACTLLGLGVVGLPDPQAVLIPLVGGQSVPGPTYREMSYLVGHANAAAPVHQIAVVTDLVLTPGTLLVGVADTVAVNDVVRMIVTYERCPPDCRPPL